MPYRQKHRGQHTEDAENFSSKYLPLLRDAVKDLSYLYSRGYTEKSSLKIVGDRYFLNERQRKALERIAASDEAVKNRLKRELPINQIFSRSLSIDGYNLLITIESALSGGFLFKGRDGCIRDIAGLSRSYHKVQETPQAIQIIGQYLAKINNNTIKWYLDAPVSNSGRLKALLSDKAKENNWQWEISLINDVDKFLAASDALVITSDSWILGRVKNWTNFSAYLIKYYIKNANLINVVD